MKSCYICNTILDEHQIDCHHIIPTSMGGCNLEWNKIFLCGNCHSQIFVEGCTGGKHSIKGKTFIVIDKWFFSTSGRTLHYYNENGEHWK